MYRQNFQQKMRELGISAENAKAEEPPLTSPPQAGETQRGSGS
jgi:hypothetical protein